MWQMEQNKSIPLLCLCFSVSRLIYFPKFYLNIILPWTSHHIWKFPLVAPCHIISQWTNFFIAISILQFTTNKAIIIVSVSLCSVSRLSNVKQLDSPSGHLLISQNSMSISILFTSNLRNPILSTQAKSLMLLGTPVGLTLLVGKPTAQFLIQRYLFAVFWPFIDTLHPWVLK